MTNDDLLKVSKITNYDLLNVVKCKFSIHGECLVLRVN